MIYTCENLVKIICENLVIFNLLITHVCRTIPGVHNTQNTDVFLVTF